MQVPAQYSWSADWSFWLSSSTYKYRSEEFKRQFSHLPDSERLVVDYACALQKDILLQGRLYLSENWLCFHSNIFRWETTISIALKDITFMTKEKTARLIPNAIQIATKGEKFFFTSFSARDRSYLSIFRLWQNVLLDKRLTRQEFWQLVHQSYGSELGLNTEEMESFHSSSEDNGQSRSSVCDDSGEKDEKLPKTTGSAQEPTLQTEGESLNGHTLPGVEESPSEKQIKKSPLPSSERKPVNLVRSRSSEKSLDLNENENLPEKSSASDSEEESDLLMEEYAINQSIEDSGKLVALRRRRRTLHRSLAESLPKRSSQHSSGDMGLESQGSIVGRKRDALSRTTTIIVVMSIFLLLLVLLNITLFLKLSKIEHAAQSLYHVQLQEESTLNISPEMVSKEEIPQYDKEQVKHVKGVLRDSIEMLEQLKSSLSMLQRSFDHLNKTQTSRTEN